MDPEASASMQAQEAEADRLLAISHQPGATFQDVLNFGKVQFKIDMAKDPAYGQEYLAQMTDEEITELCAIGLRIRLERDGINPQTMRPIESD
ncbi:hypothetical protein L596_010787 [Steinernema carpocapsae]|uniref:Uncharacterized protein n=1 Tax=Steinernema carpocapsae TaxID=34508 RepID=A0A4V6A702_STECR|nr:hypothetical protein L596_010787 [Steinernema carpocapsae]